MSISATHIQEATARMAALRSKDPGTLNICYNSYKILTRLNNPLDCKTNILRWPRESCGRCIFYYLETDG